MNFMPGVLGLISLVFCSMAIGTYVIYDWTPLCYRLSNVGFACFCIMVILGLVTTIDKE